MTLNNTNAKVLINSVVVNDGEEAKIDVVADGLYIKEDDCYVITYNDTSYGDSPCLTTVNVYEEYIVVTRKGAVETTMRYEKGKIHSCVYSFEFGSIVMEVETHDIIIESEPDYCRLYVKYDLDMGANKSQNKLNITVNKI